MISEQIGVQLSVEEMALAMSLVGSPATGKLFLYSAYGELSEEDERSRLYAAGHSMVARDLISIEDGRAQLSEHMRRLLAVLTESDFSIQYIKEEEGLASLVYSFQDEKIVEQASKQGVAYQVTEILDRQRIASGGARFFGIPADASDSFPESSLPFATLEELKTSGTRPIDSILRLLRAAALPEVLCRALAEDFHQPAYFGAILRMASEDGRLRSDEGIFTLGGKDRVWLFPLIEREDGVYVRVELGTASSLRRELEQLMRSEMPG